MFGANILMRRQIKYTESKLIIQYVKVIGAMGKKNRMKVGELEGE